MGGGGIDLDFLPPDLLELFDSLPDLLDLPAMKEKFQIQSK